MSGGSGAYGTWMPVDDFLRGRRRTCWRPAASRDHAPQRFPPPRVYRDGVQIMREVDSVCDIRRGDHCLVAVKVVRALSHSFDWFTSWLSRHGFCIVYHHFVALEDVAYVDDSGVPRTATGEVVRILEHTNTVRESLSEIGAMTAGNILRWPRCAVEFLFDKAQCQPVALAEYGDMPCLFVLERKLTEGDRDVIVERADRVLRRNLTYNLLTNNCEHTVNAVCNGMPTSPQAPEIFMDLATTSLRGLALLALGVVRRLAPWPAHLLGSRGAAVVALHAVGGATAGVPAVIRYLRTLGSLPLQGAAGVITTTEETYLYVTESLRALLVAAGGSAAFWLAASPGLRSRPLAVAALWAGAQYVPDILATWAAEGAWRAVWRP
mmetsp:Transcript_948/g.3053  ORF Transcript_948/g.3053 Transcript_948/m.3053 type:complete len:379 (+) Transcript_948:84-1220(+)